MQPAARRQASALHCSVAEQWLCCCHVQAGRRCALECMLLRGLAPEGRAAGHQSSNSKVTEVKSGTALERLVPGSNIPPKQLSRTAAAGSKTPPPVT